LTQPELMEMTSQGGGLGPFRHLALLQSRGS